MNSLIPIMYYPFKVMIVDDNAHLLESIKDKLSNEFDVLTVQHPQQAVNIANDRNKSQQYGVVVTDYEMPDMDGVELCEQIKYIPITKIMLSGQYDSDRAVEAFNNKLIDCYIIKGSENTLKQLNFFLHNIPPKYFKKLTDNLLSIIGSEKFKFLLDPPFAEIIYSKIKELSIVEYYLISNNGNFLFINKDHNYVLVVYTDSHLNEFCELYNSEPEVAKFIDLIKQKKYVPFFGINQMPDTVDFADWKQHLYIANKYDKYYWSLVELV